MANFSSVSHASFIHIDETLTNSRLQWLVWGSLALLISLIIFGLNLPSSYQVALTVLLALCVFISQLLPYYVTAISTLPLAKNSRDSLGEIEWQLAITQLSIANFFTPNQQPTDLWQAVLTKADYYHVAMVLTFNAITPLKKNFTLIIWRDQVTSDTWRQLCVLAKL